MPECDNIRRNALIRPRQSRSLPGKDTPSVARVLLHGDSALDTVYPEQQHAGLITITDKGLNALLEKKRPAESQAGGCYLIDRPGSPVMHFFPGLNMKDMAGNIILLLTFSHIS